MVLDPVQIRRLGEKKREENQRLRRHLKRHHFVERRLKRIAEEIEERVDCTQCGNCCRVATARLAERDIDRLVRSLGMRRQDLLTACTSRSAKEGLVLAKNDKGCVFLEGNLCTLYEDRPASCRDFPHLVRGSGSFLSRMWHMPDRACYCPIVYNALEAFKVEVGFVR